MKRNLLLAAGIIAGLATPALAGIAELDAELKAEFSQANEASRAMGMTSAAMTFCPHPPSMEQAGSTLLNRYAGQIDWNAATHLGGLTIAKAKMDENFRAGLCRSLHWD
jgi:hypothetical protein